MKIEKLVYMANQIGKFFESQGEEDAAAGIADHIQKFWDPRMRQQIIAALLSEADSLSPAVREAVQILNARQSLTTKS